MSKLIDDIIKCNSMNNVEINGKWYIAKPIIYRKFINQIKDSWLCLIGKSFAIHFKEDEI